MRVAVIGWALTAGLVAGAGVVRGQAAVNVPPAPLPAAHAGAGHDGGGVLYDDPAGGSSATVTQVLPNSNTSLLTFGKVRQIRVQQQIVVIEWGGTAVTMLPQQYVAAITVNKRSGNPEEGKP